MWLGHSGRARVVRSLAGIRAIGVFATIDASKVRRRSIMQAANFAVLSRVRLHRDILLLKCAHRQVALRLTAMPKRCITCFGQARSSYIRTAHNGGSAIANDCSSQFVASCQRNAVHARQSHTAYRGICRVSSLDRIMPRGGNVNMRPHIKCLWRCCSSDR